jgi:Fe2+ transport system protein FeoA
MYAKLSHAPAGIPLLISSITDDGLESQMSRMGLFVGTEITRLDEDVAIKTVRVRGPRGEVVLGSGMGGKVIAHLDDGRMLPLTDLSPGDTGHVEYVNAGAALKKGMDALGLKEDDPIELIRILPPMEYIAVVDGKGRIRLAEGMAAKILGRMGEVECQFVNAQAGADFVVEQIIGGDRAQRAIAALDIAPGVTMRLEMVGKAPSYTMASRNRCVVTTPEGLRLFLKQDQTDLIVVAYDENKNGRQRT